MFAKELSFWIFTLVHTHLAELLCQPLARRSAFTLYKGPTLSHPTHKIKQRSWFDQKLGLK
eukprot:m.9737 g.9737  ORF g.9737 m.9737 type:complete len:61 (-) comp5487_c0_seq1:708-890(-)